MKRLKKVNNEELKNGLIISLEHNEKALDYIENILNRAEDTLKYNEDDEDYQEIVTTLKYIKFVLNYVGDQYSQSLREVGV